MNAGKQERRAYWRAARKRRRTMVTFFGLVAVSNA